MPSVTARDIAKDLYSDYTSGRIGRLQCQLKAVELAEIHGVNRDNVLHHLNRMMGGK